MIVQPKLLGYLDCSTGVSGDKLLGALLEVGAETGLYSIADLQAAVVAVAPEGRVVCERVKSHGIAATRVRVEAMERPAHRTWADIRELLAAAELSEPVVRRATGVFERIAHSEARAHGVTPDQVHFHEVGALDSILDVVGVCAGMVALGLEHIDASHVATGWGTVETSHGMLPVPAPATATLLQGIPIVPGPPAPGGLPPGELTTPTGAALLATFVSSYGACAPLTPSAIGYGAGTREIGHANVCRLILGHAAETIELASSTVSVLETNVDHLSAEAVAFAADQLRAEGALDVWVVPVVMKKGRPALLLSVLVASPGEAATGPDHFAGRMVALTGTLGVRRTDLARHEADRRQVAVETPYGPVRFKVGPAQAVSSVRPEADDVARIARDTARPFHVVFDELAEIGRGAL